ncbi:MAG: glycoside hydrolase domain-containing protein [Candidatus Zipacnadales bacterium]
MIMVGFLLTTIPAICFGSPVQAGTMLFDFERDEEIALWHNEGAPTLGTDKTLEAAERFAASGKRSMRFATPAWRPEEHGGTQKWPAFEGKPPIVDWSRFDRLIMSIVNETDAPQRLMLFISDSQLPTRRGLFHRELLPPWTQVQAVIDLRKGFADRGVNAEDIQVMHFFTEDPPTDMVLYIDRLMLLEPGEELPALSITYLHDIATLQSRAVEATRMRMSEVKTRINKSAANTKTVLAWAMVELDNAEKRLAELEAEVSRADESVLALPEKLTQLEADLARIESLASLRVEFEKMRASVQVTSERWDDVVIGFATSMEKILPRAGAPQLRINKKVVLSLARNETESFQVIVLPMQRSLRDVRVQVRDLRNSHGRTLPAQSVKAVPVGYVETKAVPPYGSPHVGWWPDPILDFMETTNIQAYDAQAFWVRIKAPKEQTPGLYRGPLQVMVGGQPAFTFELAVRVYDFEVPSVSPLPLAVTFAPQDCPTPDTADEQVRWRKSPDYPVNAWKQHRSEWADFLTEYYLTIDSLYEYAGWQPAFEDLVRLRDQGKLGVFNLGYFNVLEESEEAQKTWREDVERRLRPRYERAEELGLLAHAYIYGCDEHPPEKFFGVERAAAALKQEFPEVPVMTTTYDHSFGQDSVIKSVDAFCPLTPRFNAERAAQARANGKKVWWYICCGPHHPYANMFVEYPAIEGRLLQGAMTVKYRPDGFLYYQISIWNSKRPIENGPFTDWDPRSWTTYHGDGSWTCAGPNGTPLATVRLENFRDGLEDYAYALELERTVQEFVQKERLTPKEQAWLDKAQQALSVPPQVVESLVKYTHNPDILYEWRNQMAELIEQAAKI